MSLCDLFIGMLNVIMLSVVMPNVVMLSVVEPFYAALSKENEYLKKRNHDTQQDDIQHYDTI
jgi:hypothetical protein